MPQSFSAIYLHFIFSTAHREPVIRAESRTRLHEYIGGLCRERKSTLLAAGGMPDHMHMLVSLSREAAPSVFMRDIKSLSSGWLHDTFPEDAGFAWQKGFGGFSVSHSGIDAVKQYIARQEEHHRTRTFQEEFIEFLKRHEIEYDERYIWD